MSTLLAAQMTALEAYLTQNAATVGPMSDAQVFNWLNSPTPANNPASQGQVPASFAAINAMGLLSAGSAKNVLGLPAFDSTIRPLLDSPAKDSGTISQLNQWAAGLFHAGLILQSEFDALAAPAPGTTPNAPVGLLNATQPDPTYQAQLPTGPSPRATLFPAVANWTLADGSKCSYIPFADVQTALGR